jgi:cytochrome oxidase Cu insertion factor (SCO1/SenC/PrrC family)
LWGVLAVALISIGVLFIQSRKSRSHLPEYFAVLPFALTNQLGRTVELREFDGKVWVADIIFTRCAGPCPKMTEEMETLQQLFSPQDDLRFVTLTTDPEHDTPPVMKSYAEKFNAEAERWHFLTGSKSAIRSLASDSLKLGSEEKEKDLQQDENDLFIHSTVFVLVDKRGKVRGFYESLEPGFQEKIRADITSLLQEKR